MAYLEFGYKFLGKPCCILEKNMAFLNLKNRRGQGVTVEYAVLFFIVIAAITAMSTYSKRAIQGRVRDARNYVVRQVEPAYANGRTNSQFYFEYEPYYTQTTTDKNELTQTTENQTPWAGHEGKFGTGIASTVTSRTTSNVAPAVNAH